MCSGLSYLNKTQKNKWTEQIEDLKVHSNFLANKLLLRLPKNLKGRLPCYKECLDIQPHKHWVWQFFISNLVSISAMMIITGHVPNEELLSCMQVG